MPCSVTLASYSIGDCFSSRGGVKTVWVGNYVDNAFTMSSAGTVTGFSGTTFYKQELRKNTGSMTSTLNVDEANGSNYVETEVVIEYTKMQKESRLQMNALSKGDLIVVVRDANDNYYALGTEEPCTASAGEGTTGTDKADKSAYSITLKDTTSNFPPFLDQSAIDSLPA